MTKINASEWYTENESRAAVDLTMFLDRVSRGWRAQKALMEPLGDRPVPGAIGRHLPRDVLDELLGSRNSMDYKAFNLTRTLKVWSEVIGVEPRNIRHGIDKHGSLERFLHHIGWYPGKARYVDDEVDLVLDSSPTPWVPGQRPAKRAAPARTYTRIDLDEEDF